MISLNNRKVSKLVEIKLRPYKGFRDTGYLGNKLNRDTGYLGNKLNRDTGYLGERLMRYRILKQEIRRNRIETLEIQTTGINGIRDI